MSATTMTATAPGQARPRAVTVSPVSLPAVSRSEWIKFRTLRSSWIVLAATVVAVIGIGMLVSYFTNTHWSSMRPAERFRFNAVDRSLTGVNLAQLTIGVLGVLFVSGEYGTGMIRATLSAAPTRIPVLVAKAAVFAVVTFVSSIVATVVAFATGQGLLGPHGVGWGTPGAVRAVFGAALYLTVVGLLGVALGFLVRSTAGGIGALFGLLLVLPVIFAALPSSWNNTVGPYLPNNAGGALWNLRGNGFQLSPWVGFAVFCAWAAAGLILAAFLLRRRDA
ncbi:MAG TPA: ABC transporter permease [Acidimicrobiales bacterium]|nr:ABC transporter permease [Acidimicrobiales bacterium]